MKNADKIIIHCSATPPDMDIGVDEIDQWHKQRGWDGCGYHLIIRRDGTIEQGRKLGTMGAHARGFNHCPGICMIGGVDCAGKPSSNFTIDQYVGLDDMLWELKANPLIADNAEVLGHCDLPNVTKKCPCFNVPAFFN